MKYLLIHLIPLIAIAGCAQDRENSFGHAQPSAFQGSIVGRWTTGCVYRPYTEDYSVKNLVFGATTGVASEKFYKEAPCTGEMERSTGPHAFDYRIIDKPGVGMAKLEMIVDGKVGATADAVLFDDLMTVKMDIEIRYTRVREEKK